MFLCINSFLYAHLLYIKILSWCMFWVQDSPHCEETECVWVYVCICSCYQGKHLTLSFRWLLHQTSLTNESSPPSSSVKPFSGEKSKKSDEMQKGKCQMLPILFVELAHFRRISWTSTGGEQGSSPGYSKAKGKAQLIHWIRQESCNRRWMIKTLNKSLFLRGQGMSYSGHQVRNWLQPWHELM